MRKIPRRTSEGRRGNLVHDMTPFSFSFRRKDKQNGSKRRLPERDTGTGNKYMDTEGKNAGWNELRAWD